MGPLEITVIVLCAAAVVGVIGTVVYRKLKGKPTDCGCGCANCPYSCSHRKNSEHTD